MRTGDGGYGLIDCDDSVLGLQHLPNADVAHLVRESHVPEMFVGNGTRDHRTVDLWSTGNLVHSSMEFADTALIELRDSLMSEPCRRPSITAALKLVYIE